MQWTYRVFRDQTDRYSVREVFYDRDGSLITYSKVPLAIVGDSAEELLQILAWCKAAFDLPILSLETVDAQLATQPTRAPSAEQPRLSLNEVRAALAAESEPVKP